MNEQTEDCPAGDEMAGAGQSGTSAKECVNVSPGMAASSGPETPFTVAVKVTVPPVSTTS